MPSLAIHDVPDYVQATLNNYIEKTWTDLSMPFQKYRFARFFRGKDKSKKRPEKGGPYLDFKLRIDNQDNAEHTGLYAVVGTDKKDVLTNGQVPWTYQHASYQFDVREHRWQEGAKQIISMVALDEQGLMNDYWKLMETAMWTAPSNSSLSPMEPMGIPFWLQQNSTAAFGFNGADPSGFSSGAASIATGTYADWKNGTYTWDIISPEGFVEKTVQALDYCDFEAPEPYPSTQPEEHNWGLYTVYYNIQRLRRITQASNDDHGNELAKFMNTPLIRNIPFMWVRALDHPNSDALVTNRPLYGVDWSTMEYYYKSGESMVKKPLRMAALQPTVYIRDMWNAGNFDCTDRRRNFVAYDSTV